MKESLCQTPAVWVASDIRIDRNKTETPTTIASSLSARFSGIKVEETDRIIKVNTAVKMKYECHPSSDILN